METKKWIHYGWQTFLLCIVVSASQPVLAKSDSASSTATRDNVRKSKTAKPQSAHSGASSKSTSSSRIASKSARLLKAQQTPKSNKQLAVKDKNGSQHGKSTATARSKEQPKKLAPTTLSVSTRIPYAQMEMRRANDSRRSKNSLAVSHRTQPRYVTVLKETKQQKLEKVVIAIPRSRASTRAQRRESIEPKARLKALQLARQKEQQITRVQQGARRLLAAALVKSAAPSVSESPQPQNTSTQPTTVAPTVPSPSLPALVSKESTPQDKLQSTISSGDTPQETSQTETAPVPSSPQAATVALVEPSSSTPVIPKPDQRSKDWSGYVPQKAPFVATVNDELLGYRINSLFVLPGDEIFLAVADSQKRVEYSIRSTLGPERLLTSRRWYWTAPTTTGLYQIKITNTRSNSTITLNVFVMVPLDRIADGHLNGYHIGDYPTEPLRQLAMYNRPRGLIEVTPENENTQVSPHFQLRQFLCKQDGGYPKYMILDARLLTTLEQLLEMVNSHGYQARTFSIMSGYRTPYYNRAIGNRTTYSRHLWGDAADIFIDEEPRDGRMDDLNQDGVVDAHDADVIYQMIENANEPRIQKIMMGGLARYRETSSHGPFIHVDARGSYARWGLKTLTKGGTTPTETSFPINDKTVLPSFWGGKSTGEDVR